ncbi:Hypothetical predicted protein [Olea europaea subsp. europaea]|uniref:Uncharacterized protein n=2 Tax=Olea europaea subsp. europaea TaxID=158383 RepID=A0A8S0U8M8_OLEEU|nr:Hypothetical predicted protein [Olea europaea subsp. europaea]
MQGEMKLIRSVLLSANIDLSHQFQKPQAVRAFSATPFSVPREPYPLKNDTSPAPVPVPAPAPAPSINYFVGS